MERVGDVLTAGRWQFWDSSSGLAPRFSEFRREDILSVNCLVS